MLYRAGLTRVVYTVDVHDGGSIRRVDTVVFASGSGLYWRVYTEGLYRGSTRRIYTEVLHGGSTRRVYTDGR